MFREDEFQLSSNQPASETFPESTQSMQQTNHENNLDDIWGSAPSSSASDTFPHDANNIRSEPSDIPRLRSEHTTAGYRDGISSAKNTTIQEGFDEGYSLGAAMGLEVGILLGSLEGIYNSLKNIGLNGDTEKKRVGKLLDMARKELRTEEIFGRDWWAGDGTWKFEVLEEGADGAGEFTFKDVVNSHPVIRRWKGVLSDEVERWGLDLSVMERAEGRRPSTDDER